MWGRWLRRPGGSAAKIQRLAGAAHEALETARRERLPLAAVAEREASGRAQYWFASSILRVVTIRGRALEGQSGTDLTRGQVDWLRLDDSMEALYAPGEEQPRFVELAVSKSEFAKYLRWLRTTR